MAASRLALRAHQAAKKSGGGGGGGCRPRVSRRGAVGPEENRAHFVRMKQGRYAEGEAFLRMKGDLNSDNSALWDPAAYRVMFHAHPRTGAGWCIYPTYDYTHCIVDSLENISHSLCTLEFEQRQAVDGPYYWLLHRLALYKPVTWEYSRLNITHTLMSKRKLKYLVTHGRVSGWDDPRMPTLSGLRRRGFSGRALNRFCEEVGVTRAAMTARLGLLEAVARKEMDAVRRGASSCCGRSRSSSTGCPTAGSPSRRRTTRRTRAPASARSSSRRRSTSNATTSATSTTRSSSASRREEVGLLGAHVNIKCTEVKTGKDGAIVELRATVDAERLSKTKGHLHWVSAADSVKCEVRLYDVLFTPEDPEGAAKALKEAGGGAAAAAAAARRRGRRGGGGGGGGRRRARLGAAPQPELARRRQGRARRAHSPPRPARRRLDRPTFQFQRTGFFCVDSDSTKKKPVFNRVVSCARTRRSRGGSGAYGAYKPVRR